MKNTRLRYFAPSLLLLFLLFPAGAQSRYLEEGIGGSSFGMETRISDGGIYSLGLTASYSIGGIMDFGFRLARETGTLEETEKIDWNYSFLYNLIVIKQSDMVPFSFQLEGAYGYTNVSSHYLDVNNRSQSAQGFHVAGSLYRLFNADGNFLLLLGGKGKYENYLLSEFNTATGLPVLSSTQRNEELSWGGVTALSFKIDKGPLITLQVEVLYNQEAAGYIIEPSLMFISPSF